MNQHNVEQWLASGNAIDIAVEEAAGDLQALLAIRDVVRRYRGQVDIGGDVVVGSVPRREGGGGMVNGYVYGASEGEHGSSADGGDLGRRQE